MLSSVGKEIVNREVDELWDGIHTVDLDYATYFVASSTHPAEYFESACNAPTVGRELAASEIANDDSRRSKPDTLPLAIYVGHECPVSAKVVRESAERAISREEIEPVRWPTPQESGPWFGAYAGLECGEGKTVALRVSLIDSIDGSLFLYDSLIDGSDYMAWGPPLPDRQISYPSFVRGAVEIAVSRFLRARFELR